MKTALTLLAALASLALSALVDHALHFTGAIPEVRMPVSLRIWLASAAMVAFAAVNYGLAWLALKRGGIRPWASALLILVGTIGTVYLPIWGLGLFPLLGLSSRQLGPLTLILTQGGFISLLKLQLACLLILGVAVLASRSVRGQGSSNAA